MKIKDEFLTEYKNRKIKYTLIGGNNPSEATLNYDSERCTVTVDSDELFDFNNIDKSTFGGIYYSPSVFINNKRSIDTAVSQSFVSLDYDDGYTIKEIIKDLEELNLIYVITTTKSHQKEKTTIGGKVKKACDRFRVIIPIDKDVIKSLTITEFNDGLKEVFPDADSSVFEASRIFYANIPEFIYCNNKNEFCLKTEPIIELGKKVFDQIKRYATKGANINVIKQADIDMEIDESKVDPYIKRTMVSLANPERWKKENTFQQIFGIVCHCLQRNSDYSVVYNTLLKFDFYLQWCLRHKGQLKYTAELVKKCFTTVYDSSIDYNNEVVDVDIDAHELSDEHNKNIATLLKSRGIKDLSPSKTDKLFDYCINSEQDRIILQSPCGGGKTTASIAYMATYASEENKFIYIAETRKLCKEMIDTLETLYGVKVSYFQGFDPKECHKAGYIELENGDYALSGMSSEREAYTKGFCKGCLKKCNFYDCKNNPEKVLTQNNIIVMTHSKYIRLLQSSLVNAKTTVIIDEELSRWASIEFTHNDLFLFKEAIGGIENWTDCQNEYLWFFNDIQALTTKIENTKDVISSNIFIPNELAIKLNKIFKQNEQVELNNCGEFEVYDIVNKYDKIYELLSFFSNVYLKYARHNKNDGKLTYSFACDTISYLIPNKTIILNASAIYSHITWENFKVFRLQEKISFANTTFHCCMGNPTKKKIHKGTKYKEPLINTLFHTAMDIIDDKAISKIFIAKDKTTTNSLLSEYMDDLNKGDITVINRGNILSNNSAKDCELAIITSANFTTLNDYLLKTAIASGTNIKSDRFFTKDGYVKMKQGFNDPDINREATRQMADELYQTIMRGTIRNNTNNEYDVVLVVTPALMIELMKLFPKATFKTHSKQLEPIKTLYDMTIEELDNLSKKAVIRIFGNSSKMYKKNQMIVDTIRKNKVKRKMGYSF